MFINGINTNGVSFKGNEQTVQQPEASSKPKRSLKSSLLLSAMAGLAAYAAISVGKNAYNHIQFPRNCKKIELGANEIFEKVRAEISDSLNLFNKRHNIIRNGEGLYVLTEKEGEFLQTNSIRNIEKASTVFETDGRQVMIYRDLNTLPQNAGKTASSITWLNENGEITRHLRNAKFAFDPKNGTTFAGEEVYNFADDKITNFGTQWLLTPRGEENFSQFIGCKDGLPSRIEINTKHASGKVHCEKLAEKNNKGKWKLV